MNREIPPDLAHLLVSVPKTPCVPFEVECRERLLSAIIVDHRDLSLAISDIIQTGKLSGEWRAVFENAYDKIPANKRIYARDAMLSLYCELGDYAAASKFLPPTPYTIHEIVVVMDVFLKLKRFSEAEAVKEICQKRLACDLSEEEAQVLRKAIEDYFKTTKSAT